MNGPRKRRVPPDTISNSVSLDLTKTHISVTSKCRRRCLSTTDSFRHYFAFCTNMLLQVRDNIGNSTSYPKDTLVVKPLWVLTYRLAVGNFGNSKFLPERSSARATALTPFHLFWSRRCLSSSDTSDHTSWAWSTGRSKTSL